MVWKCLAALMLAWAVVTPARAGEMDQDRSVAAPVAKAPAAMDLKVTLATAGTELDAENPTQACCWRWRGCGWGWGGGWGWGWGRPAWGVGWGWARPVWGVGWGWGRPAWGVGWGGWGW